MIKIKNSKIKKAVMENQLEQNEAKVPQCFDCGKKAVLVHEGRFSYWKGIVFYTEGAFCDDCYKKVIDKYIEQFDRDTNYTDNVVCPKCGFEDVDCIEWVKDYGETECIRCGHNFHYSRETSTHYSSR